jgi:hypothetical protein
MSGIVLRIGGFQPPEVAVESDHPRTLCMIITPRDMGQLIHKSIEAPDDLRFAIFHGVSDNQYKRLDISNARTLIGYEPQDNAFTLSNAVRLHPRRPADPDF